MHSEQFNRNQNFAALGADKRGFLYSQTIDFSRTNPNQNYRTEKHYLLIHEKRKEK